MDPAHGESGLLTPPETVAPPHEKFLDRGGLHVLLFMLTLASTTLAGAGHYAGFLDDFHGSRELPMPAAALYLRGFWYSGTILAILACHELGHYLACRYYDVDASLPYFLPMPFFLFSGTLGAFIRIRERIPKKHMLFDIGIAGPIAGFIVAVPALFIGVAMSKAIPIPTEYPPGTAELGEPLLFQFAEWLLWRGVPDGYTLNMHPVAFAAWFGLLATALNLIPVGQLDGGHIAYSVFGRISSYISVVGVVGAVALGLWSPSWYVWAGLMIVMMLLFGRHHPRVADEHVPLDRGRLLLAVVALLILIVCFTPSPMRMMDVITR